MLTIGMATYEDYNGVYFTIQSLRMYHNIKDCELIVVDNSPQSKDSITLREYLNWVKDIPIRYIGYEGVKGTAAPRNLVFDYANKEYVLCLDSHVLLLPNSIDNLKKFYKENNSSKDLIQGPMIYDDFVGYATHFDDVWRGQMWGIWGTDPRGGNPDNEPFEIPAMGLGAFSSRKDSWLGFNKNFTGFGGEEFYIHLKYKHKGHKTLCLPGFRWMHRFGRPHGVTYPLSMQAKVRNYLIGHYELSIPIDRCRNHFVYEEKFPAEEFDKMAIEIKANPSSGCGCSNKSEEQIAKQKEETKYTADDNPLTLEVTKLCKFAKTGAHFGVFNLVTYAMTNTLTSKLFANHDKITKDMETSKVRLDDKGNEIKIDISVSNKSVKDTLIDVDILAIEENLSVDELFNVLVKYSNQTNVKRILLGGTFYMGETNNGKPGILPCVRRFTKEFPEWTVKDNIKIGSGWLVLSRLKEDKKELPPTWKQGWNFIKAATRLAKEGFGTASDEVVELRLAECQLCPSRNEDRCGECGCYIEKKATWPAESCPLGKWHSVT